MYTKRRWAPERLRLRRAPELQFFYDESIEKHDRIERILIEIEQERAQRPSPLSSEDNEDGQPNPDAVHDDREDRD